MDKINKIGPSWQMFYDKYDGESQLKRIPLVDLLEMFWCFCNGEKIREKEIANSYNLKVVE